MPTFTAFTTLNGKEAATALGDAMENLDPTPTGVGVFEIEDNSGLWEVGGYFLETPDETALMLLAAAFGAKPFSISELPETDWVAKVKRELTPVQAGRFFVYGSHDADKVPADCHPLLIEAAMAFGTGHHGTTLGCLRAFDRLVENGASFSSIADIGCGTAVLAMAAASIFDGPIWASDIDPVAVDVAVANAEANGLMDKIEARVAAGFDHPDLTSAAPFDLVFANILKGPLLDLAEDMATYIGTDGHAILSGILIEQADEVTAKYESVGFALVQREDIGEWSSLTLQRK